MLVAHIFKILLRFYVCGTIIWFCGPVIDDVADWIAVTDMMDTILEEKKYTQCLQRYPLSMTQQLLGTLLFSMRWMMNLMLFDEKAL